MRFYVVFKNVTFFFFEDLHCSQEWSSVGEKLSEDFHPWLWASYRGKSITKQNFRCVCDIIGKWWPGTLTTRSGSLKTVELTPSFHERYNRKTWLESISSPYLFQNLSQCLFDFAWIPNQLLNKHCRALHVFDPDLTTQILIFPCKTCLVYATKQFGYIGISDPLVHSPIFISWDIDS